MNRQQNALCHWFLNLKYTPIADHQDKFIIKMYFNNIHYTESHGFIGNKSLNYRLNYW